MDREAGIELGTMGTATARAVHASLLAPNFREVKRSFVPRAARGCFGVLFYLCALTALSLEITQGVYSWTGGYGWNNHSYTEGFNDKAEAINTLGYENNCDPNHLMSGHSIYVTILAPVAISLFSLALSGVFFYFATSALLTACLRHFGKDEHAHAYSQNSCCTTAKANVIFSALTLCSALNFLMPFFAPKVATYDQTALGARDACQAAEYNVGNTVPAQATESSESVFYFASGALAGSLASAFAKLLQIGKYYSFVDEDDSSDDDSDDDAASITSVPAPNDPSRDSVVLA